MWLKPGLVGRVRYLAGSQNLRHAAVSLGVAGDVIGLCRPWGAV
jgi:hypothetical protein